MNSRLSRIFLGVVLATMPVFSVACGSSSGANLGGTGGTGGNSPSGNVNMVVSDASTEDWATIGVKILSISLVPQGGGSPVNIFTAGSTVPTLNLVELDQLGDLLGTLPVPAGTYTGAILTISANAGDVTLVVAADPETGFAGTPGATIPPHSDSDSRGERQRREQDRSGQCEFRSGAHRVCEPNVHRGRGVRSFSPGVLGGSCSTGGRRANDLGGELQQRPGATSPHLGRNASRAAPHLRHGVQRVLG